jgi:hypothetical protein
MVLDIFAAFLLAVGQVQTTSTVVGRRQDPAAPPRRHAAITHEGFRFTLPMISG